MTDIATVGDLIAALTAYDPDTPVRCAPQAWHPCRTAHTLATVAAAADVHALDGTPSTTTVVWLGMGQPVGTLPRAATDALGWSR